MRSHRCWVAGDNWDWFEHIHSASFRGVPFAIVSAESVFGRRQALHEYLYRNTIWVGDLGRGTRKLIVRGFIVHNSLAYNAPEVITYSVTRWSLLVKLRGPAC